LCLFWEIKIKLYIDKSEMRNLKLKVQE
jgi:hypothetical protein